MLIEKNIHCPYCSESITVLIDASELKDEPFIDYIEDCQVCCQPINFHILRDMSLGPESDLNHDKLTILVSSNNES